MLLYQLGSELERPLLALRRRAGEITFAGPGTRPERQKSAEALASMCGDLINLTRQFLDYVQVGEEGTPNRLQALELTALVRQWDQVFAPRAASLGIAWESRQEGEGGTVMTEPRLLQGAITQVIGNALKFTPRGGHIRLITAREGGFWVVLISDDGPGIPAECCGRVLEPFYRLPRDERSGANGSGLGLAISRMLVKRLGGELVVSPHPGEGTLVTLRLPADGTGPY